MQFDDVEDYLFPTLRLVRRGLAQRFAVRVATYTYEAKPMALWLEPPAGDRRHGLDDA